jgi:hypothetical protein
VIPTDTFPADCDIVTVHVVALPTDILVGVHVREESVDGARRLMVAALEFVPSEAVTLAL